MAAVPGVPQVLSAEYAMGSCTLNISWSAPSNIAIGDITHFVIYIIGPRVNMQRNVNNSNNDPFLSVFFPVSSCASHNVSINAVDRCGREGPLSFSSVNPEQFCDESVCEGARAATENRKCYI